MNPANDKPEGIIMQEILDELMRYITTHSTSELNGIRLRDSFSQPDKILDSVSGAGIDWHSQIYKENPNPPNDPCDHVKKFRSLLESCQREDKEDSLKTPTKGISYSVEPFVIKSEEHTRFLHELYERYENFLESGSQTGKGTLRDLELYAVFTSLAEQEMKLGYKEDKIKRDKKDELATTIAGASWTPEEKDKFFLALDRCGRHDAAEISRRVGTKDISAVAGYIDFLEKASKGIRREVVFKDKYSAREMSNNFVVQEELLAYRYSQKLETESFANHQKLLFDESNELAQKALQLFQVFNASQLTKLFARTNDMVVLSSTFVVMYQLLKKFIYDIIMNAQAELSKTDDTLVTRGLMNHIIAKRKRTWSDMHGEHDRRLRHMDIKAILDPNKRYKNQYTCSKSASFMAKRRRRSWVTGTQDEMRLQEAEDQCESPEDEMVETVDTEKETLDTPKKKNLEKGAYAEDDIDKVEELVKLLIGADRNYEIKSKVTSNKSNRRQRKKLTWAESVKEELRNKRQEELRRKEVIEISSDSEGVDSYKRDDSGSEFTGSYSEKEDDSDSKSDTTEDDDEVEFTGFHSEKENNSDSKSDTTEDDDDVEFIGSRSKREGSSDSKSDTTEDDDEVEFIGSRSKKEGSSDSKSDTTEDDDEVEFIGSRSKKESDSKSDTTEDDDEVEFTGFHSEKENNSDSKSDTTEDDDEVEFTGFPSGKEGSSDSKSDTTEDDDEAEFTGFHSEKEDDCRSNGDTTETDEEYAFTRFHSEKKNRAGRKREYKAMESSSDSGESSSEESVRTLDFMDLSDDEEEEDHMLQPFDSEDELGEYIYLTHETEYYTTLIQEEDQSIQDEIPEEDNEEDAEELKRLKEEDEEAEIRMKELDAECEAKLSELLSFTYTSNLENMTGNRPSFRKKKKHLKKKTEA